MQRLVTPLPLLSLVLDPARETDSKVGEDYNRVFDVPLLSDPQGVRLRAASESNAAADVYTPTESYVFGAGFALAYSPAWTNFLATYDYFEFRFSVPLGAWPVVEFSLDGVNVSNRVCPIPFGGFWRAAAPQNYIFGCSDVYTKANFGRVVTAGAAYRTIHCFRRVTL